jgi:hypothetical protein
MLRASGSLYMPLLDWSMRTDPSPGGEAPVLLRTLSPVGQDAICSLLLHIQRFAHQRGCMSGAIVAVAEGSDL